MLQSTCAVCMDSWEADVCVQIEYFVEHLTPAVVNEKIYPSIVPGFMDTNPVVREHTIKVSSLQIWSLKSMCFFVCVNGLIF